MFGGGCNAGTGASSSAEYLQSPRDKEPQYAFHCEGSDLSVRPGEVLPIAERPKRGLVDCIWKVGGNCDQNRAGARRRIIIVSANARAVSEIAPWEMNLLEDRGVEKQESCAIKTIGLITTTSKKSTS
ncbi:hypothetical protein AV530_016490 [Patagioenas fasciata monilis]|uniref:Uncharacterized protein n=1 Tax=Patagioenas fasciata monilis TaxID=372326 RepID=A0A1V4J2Q7_PATFA|nr:hypothetical protein AV530_016490 [Patagioenas fasciata monilis]